MKTTQPNCPPAHRGNGGTVDCRRPDTLVEAVSVCSHVDELSRDARVGTVYGVFSRAAYIEVDDVLVTLSSDRLGNVPWGVLLHGGPAMGLPGLHPGTSALFGPGRIRFPTYGTVVDFSRAPRWSAELDVCATEWRNLSANLGILLRVLQDGDTGMEGLASLSEYVARLPKMPSAAELNSHCQRAMSILADVVAKWTRGQLSALPREMRGLLGLGPGLTPSGDDFVIGTSAVLWLASNTAGRHSEAFRRAAIDTGREPGDATTTVGAFFVRQASLGRFPERLQDLLAALCAEDGGWVSEAAGALFDVGATSGRDMAAGVVFGAWLVSQTMQSSPPSPGRPSH
jgi:hypothetical protein